VDRSGRRVVLKVHAELVVDGPLVFRTGVRQHGCDVLELADERSDLVRRQRASGRLAAELSFEPPTLALDLGDPRADDGDVGLLLEQGAVLGELDEPSQ
jgi:hypothetical protein